MRKGAIPDNGKISDETVISKIREVETVKLNEKDLTKAITEKLKAVIDECTISMDVVKTVPKKFEYPDPKPYDYPVKVPKVNPEEVRESTKEVISAVLKDIDMADIVKNCMQGLKLNKYELVDVPLEVPVLNEDELKQSMVAVMKSAFKSIDLKALLKEVLGEIDLPLIKVTEGETHVIPKIEKGRVVTEYTIIPREKIITKAVVQLKDEQGNLITTIRGDD